MTPDPRDHGKPGDKEWEEFRASYAAARLFAWLIDELDEIAPDYAENLRGRINSGISMGELLAEEDPEYDGAAIIHSPVRREATFMDHDDAILLEDQLFPHPRGPDAREFTQGVRGLSLVAFHSALETYAAGLGATAPRMPLPKSVDRFLAAKSRDLELGASLADAFTALDETRHLVIHHRGVVTDRYMRNVKYNTFEIGELRLITPADLHAFGQTVWKVATRLRASGSQPVSNRDDG